MPFETLSLNALSPSASNVHRHLSTYTTSSNNQRPDQMETPQQMTPHHTAPSPSSAVAPSSNLQKSRASTTSSPSAASTRVHISLTLSRMESSKTRSMEAGGKTNTLPDGLERMGPAWLSIGRPVARYFSDQSTSGLCAERLEGEKEVGEASRRRFTALSRL
jgi:hypothetical protein